MAGIIFSKSSGLNDSIYGKSLQPIRAMIEQQVEAFQEMSVLDKLFVMDTTKNFAEKYTYETSAGNFEATGEGGAIPRTSMQEGYSKVIEPDEWKNSFEVTQTMIEDAKMGKIKSGANKFTLSYNRTRELFGTTLFNNANATSIAFGNGAYKKNYDISCADGLALFSGVHPSKTGGYGTQSNYFANQFSYDALCLGEEAMQNYRDDDGNLLNVMPDTIIIPNKARTKKLVFDAIGAEGIPNTTNTNSFSYQYGRWNVIITPYLSTLSGVTGGMDNWWLMDSKFNEAYFGSVWLDRIPLSVKSYVDENTDNMINKGRARFGAGFNNWRAFGMFAPGLGTTTLS